MGKYILVMVRNREAEVVAFDDYEDARIAMNEDYDVTLSDYGNHDSEELSHWIDNHTARITDILDDDHYDWSIHKI